MKNRIVLMIITVLFICAVLGGCTNQKMKINEKSTAQEVVDFYSCAVNNSKACDSFMLDVTTTVKLEAIESPSSLLNEMIEKIMGYGVGDYEMATTSYKFQNGLDENGLTPLDVIQPASSSMENIVASSIKIASVENDDCTSLMFDIDKESAELNSVVSAIKPLVKGENIGNKSDIINLAPVHSQYIDVSNILSTVIDMLGIDSLVNSSDNSSSDSNAISITNGNCILGSTSVFAQIDNNMLLNVVTINAPVELVANIKFVNNDVRASIRITVFQSYIFSAE